MHSSRWRYCEALQNSSAGRRRLLHCPPNDIQVSANVIWWSFDPVHLILITVLLVSSIELCKSWLSITRRIRMDFVWIWDSLVYRYVHSNQFVTLRFLHLNRTIEWKVCCWRWPCGRMELIFCPKNHYPIDFDVFFRIVCFFFLRSFSRTNFWLCSR